MTLVDEHWTTLMFDPAVSAVLFDVVRAATARDLGPTPRAGLIAEAIGATPHDPARLRHLPSGPTQIGEVIASGQSRAVIESAALAMIALRTSGRSPDAVTVAEACRPLLAATSTTRFSPCIDLGGYWHLQAAQAYLHAGLLDRARLDFEHAWIARDDDITGYVGPSAAPYLVLLAALLGDHEDLDRWQRARASVAEMTRALIEAETMTRPVVLADLLIASDRLDDDVAGPLAATLEADLPYDELWPLSLFAIVRHLIDVGATDRAEALSTSVLDRHRELGPVGSLHRTFARAAQAEVLLAQGRLDALDTLLRSDGGALPGLDAVTDARAYLAAGEPARARRSALAAEREARHPRLRREAAHLVAVCDLAEQPTVPQPRLDPDLRRLTAQLPEALHAVLSAAGGPDVPATRPTSGAFTMGRLTTAERRALEALAHPGTIAQVAASLHVSTNTLKTQARTLYRKLNASSRDEAIALARRFGLLD